MTRWRTRHRGLRDDRGAAAVEFAIVLVVLLLIIFGIIDFGRLLYVKQAVESASREGVRTLVIRGTTWGAGTAAVSSSADAAASLAGGATVAANTWTDYDSTGAARGTGSVALDSDVLCPGPTNYTAGATSRAVTVSVTISPFSWFTPTMSLLGTVVGPADVQEVAASTTMRCE